MKKILTLAFIILLAAVAPAHADKNISQFTSGVSIGTADLVPYWNSAASASTATSQATFNNFGKSLWSVFTSSSGLCAKALGGDACTLLFGFADPRGYGGHCDDRGNNNFHDDSPAFTSASLNAYGLPVVNPGNCKLASTIQSTQQNQVKIFSFPFGVAYDPNQSRAGQAYLYVPNFAASGYVFDQNGYGGSSFFNIQLSGNYINGLMSGWGNTYPSQIRSGTNFNYYENVGCGDMEACIGTLADGTGAVVGVTQNYIIQQVGHDVTFGYGYYGEFNNWGDTFFERVDSNSMQGPAIATIAGFSSGIFISDFRSESGGGPTNLMHGSVVYWNAAAQLQLTTFYCDRGAGPCLDVGPLGAQVNVSNMAGSGGISIGTAIPYNATIVVEGSVGHTTKNVDIENFNSIPNLGKYVLQTIGTSTSAPDYITLRMNHGDSTAYNTALFSFDAPVTHFLFDANGADSIRGTGPGGDAIIIGAATKTAGTNLTVNGGIAVGTASVTFPSVAPTITSGFGTSPSIVSGTATSFRVNVGTGGSATAGVIGMPAAANHWNCQVNDLTNNASFITHQDAGTDTTTGVSVKNYSRTTGSAIAWTASDILAFQCSGE